jgi:hypothetical protein
VRRAVCCVRREAARGAALPPSWSLLTAGGWRGQKRRIAIFCDKLTNLGWLTLSVLKYLMETKKYIRESACKNAIAFFQLH